MWLEITGKCQLECVHCYVKSDGVKVIRAGDLADAIAERDSSDE